MRYIARKYPEWSVTLRKLAAGAFVMSYTRRVDVVSMVNLLHLASGNTVLKIRCGSLMAYKGGFYEAIGDIGREHILTRCALFSQTRDGLLMQMGDIGICSRKEDAFYCAAEEVYRRMAIMLSLGWLNCPNIWTRGGAAPSSEPSCRVAERELFATLRDALSTDKEADSKTPSWARSTASMCRKIDDTLHMTMVIGSIFAHYVEYLAPSTSDRVSSFLREAIARSRSRGALQRYAPI